MPRQHLMGDASASWTIEMPELSLRWKRNSEGEIRLTSLQTADAEWVTAPSNMVGTDATDGSIRFHDMRAGTDSMQLMGRLESSGLTVLMTWKPFLSTSAIMADLEVVNETDAAADIGNIASLHMNIPRRAGSRLAVLAGGRWDEALPPRGYRLQAFDLDGIAKGVLVGAAEDGRSSGEHVPWFALSEESGGLFAGLVWSGRWNLQVAPQSDGNLLSFGIADLVHRLAPGERIQLPSVVVCGYAGDLDDGANAWRRWIVEHWMPPVPESWPWIQYNHWYAYYGDIRADRLLDEARLAADAGCEVFVIDDGWFRGRVPDSYYAGWGDWVEDRQKFPEGIRTFGDQVRSARMRFGLWVEPERADDEGALVRQHPDWVATRQGEPIRRIGTRGAEGVHLCLGNPDVQRWMMDEMVRVVREYGVDWLKWDYNIGYGLGCDAHDHGHQPGDGHYAHTLGLYEVLEGLRSACPDLVVENCASGGHRVDLGMVRYTHTNWVSDYTHRAASCRQHSQGAGLFLPIVHLNTWTLEDRDISGFRSRMGGAFGISSFLGEWTDEERDTFRQAVAEYRQLRPYLAGDRFLLTGPWHGDWDIWQFVHPSRTDIVVVAFHERNSVSEVQVIPRVSNRARDYEIRRWNGESHRMTGEDLTSHGIRIQLPRLRSSEIIWVTAGGTSP